MTTKDKIARRKLSLLDLASELSNVSRACKVMGYSRQQFYEIRRNFQTYGAEGLIDQHPYELFLQLEEIEHRTTKVRRPQSNGIVERFHRTVLDEHFRVEGRRTWFETIEEMQAVLDEWLALYNTRRPHQGRNMGGRTPLKAFTDGLKKPPKRLRKKRKERR